MLIATSGHVFSGFPCDDGDRYIFIKWRRADWDDRTTRVIRRQKEPINASVKERTNREVMHRDERTRPEETDAAGAEIQAEEWQSHHESKLGEETN